MRPSNKSKANTRKGAQNARNSPQPPTRHCLSRRPGRTHSRSRRLRHFRLLRPFDVRAGGHAAAPATPSAAAMAATVDLHKSTSLGPILVDAQGKTLYLFEADKNGKSACSGPCATAWPPLLSNGAPQAAMGASASLIGTTTRGDGGSQVTYAGHPLYYYVGDQAPGDVTGEGIDQFGAKWYVVGKDGKKIDND